MKNKIILRLSFLSTVLFGYFVSSCSLGSFFEGTQDNNQEGNQDNNQGSSTEKTNTNQEENKSVAITKITLNPKTLSMYLEEEQQLSYTILPESAKDNPKLTFTSSNAKVATVSDTGLVKSVAAGRATITVTTDNGKRDTATVTVNNSYNITSVNFISKGTTLFTSETYQLQANYSPSTYKINLSYFSSNATVASVSNTGLVTALKEGSTTLYAFYDTNNNKKPDSFEKSASINITVKKLISYVGHEVKVLPFDFFNKSSQYSYDDLVNSISYINVYELENQGRVPYINGENFIKLLKLANVTNTNNLTSSISNNVLTIKNNNDYSFIFDSDTNKITIKNFATYQAYTIGTTTISGPSKTKIGGAPLEYTTERYKIRDVGKSKILKTGEDVNLDIGKYGLSFYKLKSDFFIPLNVVIDLVCPYNRKWMYNGNIMFSSYNYGKFYPYITSGPTGFSIDAGKFASSYPGRYELSFTKGSSSESNVKYFYAGSGKFVDNNTPNYISAYMKFYKDGKGQCFYKCYTNSPTDYTTSKPTTNATVIVNDSFTYEEINSSVIKIKTNSNEEFFVDINCPNSYSNSENIPEGLKEHNYNILRYKFEEFYGLDEYKQVKVDEFCKQNKATIYLDTASNVNYASNNKITDTYYKLFMHYDDLAMYEKIFVSFIGNYCNDLHTTLQNGPSIARFEGWVRNNLTQKLAVPSNFEKANNAFNSLSSVRKNYFTVENNKPYFFYKNKTAVLCMDNFKLYQPLNNKFLSVYTQYTNASWKNYSAMLSNVIMFYSFFCDIYKNHKEIKNVVIDVSLNSGGYLQGPLAGLAFYSDNTNYVFEDKVTKQIALYNYLYEYYANNTDKNYIRNNTKLYVLTSNVTFSAANIFAGLVKTTGAGKIIGNKTAGGACYTLMEVDALGTNFSRSGTEMVYGYDYSSTSTDIRSKLTDIEVGVEPDIVLNDYDTYYNHTKLDTFLNNLS